MKRTNFGIPVMLLLAAVLVLGACGGKGEENDGGGAGKALEDMGDGISRALDTETAPFKGGGVRIEANKREGFVHFHITDKSGNDTKEYYRFYPKENLVERLSYVAMMGTQFIYRFDYEKGAMLEVIDDEGENVIDSARNMGRLEKPEEETAETAGVIQDYFQRTYGMSIADAIE